MPRERTISREYIDKYEDGMTDMDLLSNKNIDWLTMQWTRPIYAAFVFGTFMVLKMSKIFEDKDCWTVTNMIHGVTTFLIFHWVKGCPDESTQGAYNGLTLYEQMDAGTPWTITKKFFMLVPTVITLLACAAASYEPVYVVVNLSVFLILIIAKIPEMHRVRIFGINSTEGIDSKIEYTPPRKASLERMKSTSSDRGSGKKRK
jgi:hypothetical protein